MGSVSRHIDHATRAGCVKLQQQVNCKGSSPGVGQNVCVINTSHALCYSSGATRPTSFISFMGIECSRVEHMSQYMARASVIVLGYGTIGVKSATLLFNDQHR